MAVLEVLLQSGSSVSLLGTLLVLFLVYFLSRRSGPHDDRKEPPGPRPLPLLGNLLQLDLKRPHLSLLQFSRQFGSVFTVYFGTKKVVVLAGYRTVKEALVTRAEDFGERDPLRIAEESNRGHGVVWSNGDSWREMRRFALANLRDFGMGRKACEDKIVEECQNLVLVFKSFKGQAFDNTRSINYAVSNIICSMVYGRRFHYDDPVFTTMVDRLNRNIQLAGTPSVQLLGFLPLIGRLSANRAEFHRLAELNRRQNTVLFQELRETLNPQMCRGFIDAFLVRQQQETGEPDSKFHDDNLMMTVQNLFAAGTDTTATTLRWSLLLLAKCPEVQERVQTELSRVVGNRQVRVDDRKNLPFTDAVIHETQRLANILPVALPHKTSRDLSFQGHFIEKGTTVYPLLASVLYDQEEWETPHAFNPAHFLDHQGRFVKKDAFMPFSAGRRVCLGEGLARMELFLFFSSLLQHFRFSLPPGVSAEQVDLTPQVGLTQNPLGHLLCAEYRL